MPENEQLKPLESYNFISECFFLTHQCLNMGFKPLNEKFVKLNQSLGRIQRLYQDATNQGGNDSMEPVRQLKSKMEEGMKHLLSLWLFEKIVCPSLHPHPQGTALIINPHQTQK